MPGSWIFAIICFVVAGLAAAAVFFSRDKFIPLAVAAVAGIIGVISTMVASYDRVDTRNVGIITAFGRPVEERGAGIAWHAPWEQMSELTEAIQLQAFEGVNFHNPGTAVNVRLANNSQAFVSENLNWRLRAGSAPKLFQDYGGSKADVFKVITENLVDRQAQVALSHVFAAFDPTTQAQGTDLPKLALEVKKALQDAVGGDIEILDVRIPRIFYDDGTQQRIDAHNQKVQETLNAEQDVRTAEQNRRAAEERAKQPVPDIRIAISNCINAAAAEHRDAAGCFGQIGGTPLIEMPKP